MHTNTQIPSELIHRLYRQKKARRLPCFIRIWGVLWGTFVLSVPVFAQVNMDVTFKNMDLNNTGAVTHKAWRIASEKSFAEHDWNGDNRLTGTEKKGKMKTVVSSTPFRIMDRNGDNVISRSEWTDTTETFYRLDLDGSRTLSVQEFLKRGDLDQFQQLDRNNDGIIVREEWNGGSRSFNRLDRNGDEKVSRVEFYDWAQDKAAVFSEMDANNNGEISRAEWTGSNADFNRLDADRNAVVTQGEFNSTAAQTTFSAIDTDRDGMIERAEWTSTTQEFNRLDDDHNSFLTEREFSSPDGTGPGISIATQLFEQLLKVK